MTLPALGPHVTTIVLLLLSNVFMTFAWYGHLKYKSSALWLVILASWGIAFFEYLAAGAGQPWGHGVYNAAQLKTMQEIITLAVFVAFSVWYLGEPIEWNHLAGFALIRLRVVPDLRGFLIAR